MILHHKKAEFKALFGEFISSFVSSSEGAEHISWYTTHQESGRANYREILAVQERGEDITDAVLAKLLPHTDSDKHRQSGQWIHYAPAITGDIRSLKEASGETYDWQKIAHSLFNFFQHCHNHPDELETACESFQEPGYQCGMLTPMLNALQPDQFSLVNSKPLRTVHYFSGKKYSPQLNDYPSSNQAIQVLVQEVTPDMEELWPDDSISAANQFDMFCHWLVTIKEFSFPDYWKIAPGVHAWQWEECKENGFIGIGWDDLGDLSTLSTQKEFKTRFEAIKSEHLDWHWQGVKQAWIFVNKIRKGDRIVANRGKSKVLGIGTVTGPYYFSDDALQHKHRLPIRWDDLTERQVNEPDWNNTLRLLTPEDIERIMTASSTFLVHPDCPFSPRTFELLDGLHQTPRKTFYDQHKSEFKNKLETPFKQIFEDVAVQLPEAITDQMETSKGILAKILKNDFGQGGAWDFYWGAFYKKGGKRINDVQLFIWVNHQHIQFGFYIGAYGSDQRQQFLSHCQEHYDELVALLGEMLDSEQFRYGDRPNSIHGVGREWLRDPITPGVHIDNFLSKADVLKLSHEELVSRIATTFKQIFPFVLLAISENPMSDIADYLELNEDENDPIKPQPIYTLQDCAKDTFLPESELEQWVEAIARKKQAVLYGPPGTGKTFLATALAKHLVSGGEGYWDLLQFHPAYTYEEFMEGLRPVRKDGGLDYVLMPGRFRTFCARAKQTQDTCVLIIDEINRANLSKVFGELMYLLEYRDQEIELASGTHFKIPTNVRIIGTMNTADRSIALVDHALRRRFAFFSLPPNYDSLEKYHFYKNNPYPIKPLISVLETLNQDIGDRNYQLGTSFFLRDTLEQDLSSIWQWEIEPYLEEYFFDQADKVAQYRWSEVEPKLKP